MIYHIEYSPRAIRQFRKLPQDIQKQLKVAIEALREDPRPYGYKLYKSEPQAYRIRSGSYRVVYEIQDDVLKVLVLRLGHRRDIY